MSILFDDIRLVLFIIGGIILLAFLWDGLRSHHQSRQQQVKRQAILDEQKTKNTTSPSVPNKEESLNTTTISLAAQQELETPIPKNNNEILIEEVSLTNEPLMPTLEDALVIEEIAVINKENAAQETIEEVTEIILEQEKEPDQEEFPKEEIQEVIEPIIFTLKSSENHSFAGFRLLHLLLKNGFHFNGASHLFDYHLEKNKQNTILFSLAAATKTGTFDLANMANFSCKGLVLFFDPKQVDDALMSFEEILIVAEHLADELSAELVINKDQPWDVEHLNQLRQICQGNSC